LFTEHELKIQVDHCLDLPNNIQTVVARAQLSQQIHEMAKREFNECEELVYEQHLQQQGWASVVANMEDLTNEFHERNEDFYRHFNDYLVRREEYIEFLTHFSDDLLKLANIPILPGLVHNAEEKPFDAFNDMFKEAAEHFSKYDSSGSGNDKSDTSGGESSVSCAKRKRLPSMNVGDGAMQVDGKTVAAFTLLQWILASENQKSLREMASNCHSGLEKLDQSVLDKLKADAQSNIDSAQREDMKEIKGLSDRLSGLEKLMSEAREVVQEQQVLSQAFQQNQARAANLGDASILPDLCASHRSQLLVMVKNHNKLKDYRRRCAKSKDELCKNIHKRLT
jgi:RB1-inducible coiled-coil protein 1